MSGYPAQQQQPEYDDGYGQAGQNGHHAAANQNGQHAAANTDSYYQDEHQQQYYDNNGYDAHGNQQHAAGADGYYDEA